MSRPVKTARQISLGSDGQVRQSVTDSQVFHDAARILEELLERRLDERLKVPSKVRQNKYRRNSGRPNDERPGADVGVTRSKTLPLEPSIFLENEPSASFSSDSKKRTEDRHLPSSESSNDTDDEREVSEKSRKKNLFRKARDRLLHTFHRKLKENQDKYSNNKKESSLPIKEISDDKVLKDVNTSTLSGVNNNGSPKKEDKKRNKKHKAQKEKVSFKSEGSVDPKENTGYPHQLPYAAKTSSLTREPDSSPRLSPQPFAATTSVQPISPSLTSESPTILVPTKITGAVRDISKSEEILKPAHMSDGSSNQTLSSTASHVLDSPGDDIEYIDLDTPTSDKTSTADKDVPMSVNDLSVDRHVQGAVWSVTTPEAKTPVLEGINRVAQASRTISLVKGSVKWSETVIVADAAVDSNDQGMAGMLVAEKDLLYEKIVQKLIEMGDMYTAGAGPELVGTSAVQSDSLTELEQEIIDCLRTGGDRWSKQLDNSLEEMTQQVTQDAYLRFQSTVQHSLGNNLSWDQLAFLFYTTKGVVSAVGKGSRTASQVKEFTLQYITDTFATWIMDQGGFESVLSSGESDFDVD